MEVITRRMPVTLNMAGDDRDMVEAVCTSGHVVQKDWWFRVASHMIPKLLVHVSDEILDYARALFLLGAKGLRVIKFL